MPKAETELMRTVPGVENDFSKEPFVYRFEPCVSFEAGAKVSLFSESPKDSRTFFNFFQNVSVTPKAEAELMRTVPSVENDF